MRVSILVVALVLPVLARSQTELAGRGQFPQFRTLSGLVGGAFAIGRDGAPGIRGAMGISTPVAYGLSADRGTIGFGTTNGSMRLELGTFREEGRAASDSTAQGMIGVRAPAGRLVVGGMVLSKAGDSVLNLHYQPHSQPRGVTLGIGVQDVFSSGGSAGEFLDKKDGGLSRSLYAVATAEGRDGSTLSLGVGTMRFRTLFGNASVALGDRARAVGEYDGFNWNFGVAARVAGFDGPWRKRVDAHLFIGVVRGKYAMWTVNLTF
jgi:hypothetical protein